MHRPALLARLNEGLQQKTTLVMAPAGYGKTTLVGEWVQQLDRTSAWLSLDVRDNDVIRFWQYVYAAIDQAEPGFLIDKISSGMLFHYFTPGNVEPLLVKLLNALEELPRPLVLVLDDWHVIHDHRITESMSFFIDYLPSSLHLCFISRRPPEGFKARWLSRGWVNKLETESLRFNLQEANVFFHIHGWNRP